MFTLHKRFLHDRCDENKYSSTNAAFGFLRTAAEDVSYIAMSVVIPLKRRSKKEKQY